MNINVNAAASVAGTSRAAARGGETDARAAEATRQQSTAEAPAGKKSDSSAVDAGDQTGDRDGHGQQVLDVFEHGEEGEDTNGQAESGDQDGPTSCSRVRPPSEEGTGSHLDLEA